MKILTAVSEEEILACFPVFQLLRPHLIQGEFVARIQRQQAAGYRMISIADAGGIVAAGGYRLLEFLAWGKILYVDDLITHPRARGTGCAGALLDWLMAAGRQEQCAALHLDSGFQRHDAHRLYLNKGMVLACHHFSFPLNPPAAVTPPMAANRPSGYWQAEKQKQAEGSEAESSSLGVGEAAPLASDDIQAARRTRTHVLSRVADCRQPAGAMA